MSQNQQLHMYLQFSNEEDAVLSVDLNTVLSRIKNHWTKHMLDSSHFDAFLSLDSNLDKNVTIPYSSNVNVGVAHSISLLIPNATLYHNIQQ